MFNKKLFTKITALTMAACMTVAGAMLAAPQKASAADMVKLSSSKIKYETQQGVIKGYYASGYVAVQDVAGATKSVVVHYTYDSTTWGDATATYVKTDSDGSLIYSFNTATTYPSYHYYNFPCKFAVKYTVNGTTYWDNNGGNNYYITSTNVPGTTNQPYVLSKANVVLDNAASSVYNGVNTITGSINLKNLAYTKAVKVRYSTDNWVSYKEVNAAYAQAFGNNVEQWNFQIAGVSTTATVKFAVSYTVNSVTYWDNNFNANYTLAPNAVINK